MTADWTSGLVVRDRAGHAVAVVGVIAMHLTGPRAGVWVHAARLAEFGPLTPVLDADGLPVVRTVGDLTARHIGKRVRLRGEHGYVVAVSYVHHSGRGTRLTGHVVGGLGGAYANTSPSTTPCEVLP